MKQLQNKKTGERGYLVASKGVNHYVVTNDNWDSCGEYNSLAELNAEWEDYEEPTLFWYIDDYDTMLASVGESLDIEHSIYTKRQVEKLKAIGNYFETEEEAEKAVEKLKAWKRLKDKGIFFEIKYSRYTDEPFTITGDLNCTIGDKTKADLDLLFGGKE